MSEWKVRKYSIFSPGFRNLFIAGDLLCVISSHMSESIYTSLPIPHGALLSSETFKNVVI